MIQKYEFNDTTQLSPHFNAKEFRCKCGNGNVDLDICYKDFPTIIKGKGLNGYGKEKALTNPPAPVSDDGISVEVTVDGKKYSGKLNKA